MLLEGITTLSSVIKHLTGQTNLVIYVPKEGWVKCLPKCRYITAPSDGIVNGHVQ